MLLVACLKLVPDASGPLPVPSAGTGLALPGVETHLDPLGEYALEAALQARAACAERGRAARLLALSVGGTEAEAVLRLALAVGADEALLIRCASADAAAAARLAAAALLPRSPAWLFCGRAAADDGLGFFPAVLAESLNAAFIPGVWSCRLAEDGAEAECRRRVDGGEELLRARSPAVLSCERGAQELRVPALKKRLESRRAAIPELAPADLELGPDDLEPAARILECLPPVPRGPGQILSGAPAEAARQLLGLLRARGLLPAAPGRDRRP